MPIVSEMMEVANTVFVPALTLAALVGFLAGWWIRSRRDVGKELTLKRRFDNRLCVVEEDARRVLERTRLEAEAALRKVEAERDSLYNRLSRLDREAGGAGSANPARSAGLAREKKDRRFNSRPLAGEGVGAPPTHESDDLTSIKGIGPAFAARLNGMGYRRYFDLARWTSDDLDGLAVELGARTRLKEWSERATELHLRKYGGQR